jgi:hypothetical protein
MESYNLVSTLIEDGLQLQTNMGEEFVDQYDYQRLVGSLIFFIHIHLDISFVVNYVSIYICLLLKKHIWMKQNGFYVTYEGRANMV